jgi:hypothetical protein
MDQLASYINQKVKKFIEDNFYIIFNIVVFYIYIYNFNPIQINEFYFENKFPIS